MNAADETRFASIKSASADTPGIKKAGTFVMIYHGTLTRVYGLDCAVEAFALAHDKMPDAEMWILGSGPEAPVLEDLAKRRGLTGKVKLIGQVKPGEIPHWLSQSNVGILPFRRDVFLDFAFPNKLPEFIVTGKTVIISRLRTIQHYFSDKALVYFEPDDPSDLAKQMIRVYEDRDLCEQRAAQAMKEYAAIRWDLMRERYLALIGRMVEGAPA